MLNMREEPSWKAFMTTPPERAGDIDGDAIREERL
jgi:hypothetical protein